MTKRKNAGGTGRRRERRVEGTRPRSSLVVVSRQRRALESARSRALGPHPQPVARPPDCLAHAGRSARRAPGLSEVDRAPPRAAARIPRLGGVVPAAPRPDAPEPRGLFQHGVRVERGAAHLFGRPRECGGGSAQGGERPRGAGGRRGPSLPAGVLPADDRCRWESGGALSLQRASPAPDHPGAWSGRRMAPALNPARRVHDLLRAWQVRVGAVVLYLLDSSDPANRPAVRGIASELDGGGPELRLRQELLLGIGGGGFWHALGSSPRSVIQRGGMRPFGPGAGPDLHGRERPALRRGLAVTRAGTCSPPTPRWRPASTASRPRSSSGTSVGTRRSGWASSRPAPRARTGASGRPGGAVQHGVPRASAAVRRSTVSPPARRREPRLLQSLSPVARDRGPVAHVTNGVHTPTWDWPRPTCSGPGRAGASGGGAPWDASSRDVA